MPNTPVRAAAEGMPDVINRRAILTGIGAVAIAAAVTCRKAESAGLDEEAGFAIGNAEAIPVTREKTSLDAMLLELPPEEAHRLRVEILAIIAAVNERCARGDDFQSIRDFIRTRCQQNQMDWKRARGI